MLVPRRWGAVVLAALIVAGSLPSTVGAVNPTSLQWWPPGQTDVGDGFHLRVPVTVRNTNAFAVHNGVVLAEIDIAEKLIEGGWVKQPRGGRDILRSFELDPDSVRVVGMTSLEGADGTSGLLRAYDTSYPAADARRFEVPSHFFEGFLQGETDFAYDPAGNPTITVMWRVEGRLAPGDERYFVVYFDSLANGKHDPATSAALRGGGMLERAFWSGPSTDVLGFVSPSSSQAGRVTVVGLEPDTSVQVLLASAAGVFAPQASTGLHSNPFTVGSNEVKDIFISNTAGTAFRLVASKPIMGFVDSEGFIPSRTGDIAGTDFVFGTRYGAQEAQDSLFVYNRHPSAGATVVRIQSTDGQFSKDVHLSDSINQFPYSLGTRWTDPQPGGVGCVFPDSPEAAALPVGPGSFRATVVSGGPVSLQLQPVKGITQIPSKDGAPVGGDFWSTLSRSTATPQGANCLRNVQQYAALAASNVEARLELWSEEAATRLFPPCSGTSCGLGEPIGPFPEKTLDGRTFDTGDFSDRPLNFRFDGPTSLFVSPVSVPSLGSAPLRGPLGGSHGARNFTGIGPTDLYAPYPDTTVEATLEYAVSGAVNVVLPLATGRLTPLPQRSGADRLLWYSLEADRPVLVLPRGAAPGFLAGVPALLAATVHDADYRGYLIELRSASGLDPVTASTVPGVTASFEFTVTNLGRGAGATNLPDTVEFSAGDLPPGWSATLSRTAIRLETGESQSVVLGITPPTSALPGDLANVPLTAKSRSNPNVLHSVSTVTHIKRTFEVGLWFDQVDGPKSLTDNTDAGVALDYDVVVQNLGTVFDSIELSFTAPDVGWEVDVFEDGVPRSTVGLEALATAELTLRVKPPASSPEGVLVTTLEARSLSSPAVLDRIAATTKVQSPSLLRLTTDNDTVWVPAGTEALFNMTLKNLGQGTTEVVFELQSERRAAWSEPKLFLRGTSSSVRTFIDRISLSPGQEVALAVATTAVDHARALERLSVRFSAAATTDAQSLEDFLAAVVQPEHDLVIPPPPVSPFSRGGLTMTVDLRMENKGNLNERLRVNPSSIPPGWKLVPPSTEIAIPRNATQNVKVVLTAPSSAVEGLYNFTLDFVSQDGNRTRVKLGARVGGFASDAVEGTNVLKGQPGRPVRAVFTFENLGNVAVEAVVAPDPAEPWNLVGTAGAILVPAGAKVDVPVSWDVPIDAGDGSTQHRAFLKATPSSTGVAPYQRALERDVDVSRPDLALRSAAAFSGAAGSVVHIVVVNIGQRTAYEATVLLRVAGEVVDEVTIGEVPAGGSKNATLLWPDDRKGVAEIVVDPAARIPEASETNNALTVEIKSSASKPAPTVPAVVILAALFLFVRKRT